MQLDTSRFGTIEIDDADVLTFTHPIIGFQEYRRFVVLPGPKAGITWLQSTESRDLAFLLLDPVQVVPDYAVHLGEEELAELAAKSVADLEVRTLLVVPHEKSHTRTNLKAPILINRKHRLAKQTILERSEYPVRFYLAEDRRAARQEVSNARTHS